MYVHFYLVPILKRIQPCKVPLNKKKLCHIAKLDKACGNFNIFFLLNLSCFAYDRYKVRNFFSNKQVLFSIP